MNGPSARHRRAADELDRDRRTERLLLWKGLVALAVVIVLAWVRHVYFR